MFRLRGVGMKYGDAEVLRDVTMEIGGSQFVALVGPNGAGKSTLLGILAGLREGHSGTCEYRGESVHRWKRRLFAREVSFVPQTVKIEFPFTAEQVVLMGRTPHCDGLFEAPGDWEAVERAMETTGTLPFRSRDFRSLSGGERQLVVLASAIAQEPRTLLLDEPATFLDVRHQLAIYGLLRELTRLGTLVIAVTHDLNLAATFADRVIALHAGRVAADGAPQEVLAPERIREVFGIASEMHLRPSGTPWITYGA
ncbi:MAG TPA: ABC transporter ATP-binding protein [Bryobacteraceae bacterium]|nr:ABC transporter ATP-binding protein [Bryobacteraceae bacterium]